PAPTTAPSAHLLPPATSPSDAPATVTPQPTIPGASPTSLDLTALATKVNPALVDINTQLSRPNIRAAGTGIVLGSSGRALTNSHVINDAVSIGATDMGNGKPYTATVVGRDPAHDIAVLRLADASDLVTAAIGDSNEVALGDEVAAIGNAGG